jgi:prevent-host-death family protein
MAVITVRALLRDATAVFNRIEKDSEPQVITRHGHPVAALVPIDQDQAEAMILSAAPELVESRRRAANARAEGRTTSLSDALRSFEVEQVPEGAEQNLVPGEADEPSTDPVAVPWAELTYLVGAPLAAKVNESATRRVDEISRQAFQTAAAAGLFEEDEPQEQLLGRIQNLNSRLLERYFRHEILRDALERVTAVSAGASALHQVANPTEGILGKSLTDEALDAASAYVNSINTDLIARSSEQGNKLSPEIYEASLGSCVTALERADALASSRRGIYQIYAGKGGIPTRDKLFHQKLYKKVTRDEFLSKGPSKNLRFGKAGIKKARSKGAPYGKSRQGNAPISKDKRLP